MKGARKFTHIICQKCPENSLIEDWAVELEGTLFNCPTCGAVHREDVEFSDSYDDWNDRIDE